MSLPLVRVVRGNPSQAEIAAVEAAFVALARADLAATQPPREPAWLRAGRAEAMRARSLPAAGWSLSFRSDAPS